MLPVKDSSYYGTKFGVLAVEANSAVSAWRPTTYDIGTFNWPDWIQIREMHSSDRVAKGEGVGHM
jgi:hypothetical protein